MVAFSLCALVCGEHDCHTAATSHTQHCYREVMLIALALLYTVFPLLLKVTQVHGKSVRFA